MAPLEPWEKAIITGSTGETFLNSTHGKISCTSCHGGKPDVVVAGVSIDSTVKEAAHEDFVNSPSSNADKYCAPCHAQIVENNKTSLHSTLNGEKMLIEKRTGIPFENHSTELKEEYEKDCGKCHTTCGQCHISRPSSVGGGFIASHKFSRLPNQTNQCMACHGSRVGEEYTGSRVGYKADVHYMPKGKNCMFCHPSEELHGNGTLQEHRYDYNEMPSCEDCHNSSENSNDYHLMHWGELQCQVCHSQDYKNCNSCHPGQGITGSSYIHFKIGKNPIQTDQHPYDYVTLRHIPIAPTTFDPWNAAQPDYNTIPSWKYTTPHNIQRWTARTDTTDGKSCGEECHNSPATADGFFLREIDLQTHPDEADANRPFIVPDSKPTEW